MFSEGIERVRQQAITFSAQEKEWKVNPPAGMEYKGFRFEPYRDAMQMGWTLVPVFEPLTGATGGGEGK